MSLENNEGAEESGQVEGQQAEGQQEGQEGQEQQQMPDVKPDEVKARQTGWVSKQEWIEQGKDPDDWISARRYNSTGDLISQIKGLQSQVSGFDQRIANNNAIWKAKLETEKAELVQRRDTAIDNADRKSVRHLDDQINKVDLAQAQLEMGNYQQQGQPAQQAPDPNVQLENQYFSGLPRGQQPFAAQVGQQLASTGLVGQSLVNAVQAEINKEFPPTNPRRNNPGKTDSGRKASGGAELTLDSLSANDKKALQALKRTNARYAKMSDSAVLKMMKDTKK